MQRLHQYGCWWPRYDAMCQQGTGNADWPSTLEQQIRMAVRLSDIPYYAVRTLPKLLCYVVTLVNDEVLIEDLENLAALEFSHCLNLPC